MPETAAHQPLHRMFTEVPPRYDLINHIITLGLDNGWRRAAAKACLADSPRRILDLGCGTGDLALTIARQARYQPEIVGLDYSAPMLEIARQKAQEAKAAVTFRNGNAAELPFPEAHFDCIGISFAFRNLTYRNPLAGRVLSEVHRVLKAAGRFVIVESSQPASKIVRACCHAYLNVFVRNAGYLVSRHRAAYRYLAESAAHFYTPPEVERLLIGSGFRTVSYRPLLLGAAGITIAIK